MFNHYKVKGIYYAVPKTYKNICKTWKKYKVSVEEFANAKLFGFKTKVLV